MEFSKFTLEFSGEDWKIARPTARHMIYLTDWLEDPNTPEKEKNSKNFISFHLIYSCLYNQESGDMGEKYTFREFMDDVSVNELARLKEVSETFRGFLEDFSKSDENQDEQGGDKELA